MADATKVVIVDDHTVVRAGLRLLIDQQDDMACVGEFESPERAAPTLERLAPDVVVMDIEMPGAGGLDGTRAVLRRRPECRVLVLSMHEEPDVIRRAFEAGAAGYVAKAAADDQLIDAIRSVIAGERYLNPGLGAALAGPSPEDRLDVLSNREREVLELLALGHTNQEISEQLHLGVRTVESHRSHIMRKLGTGTRAELVGVALRAGLLDDARRTEISTD
ncbi:MAG: response regulator [Miltoncostaeaceae bacterium]